MICIKKFRLKKDGTANSRCLCKHPELIENYDKAIADTTQVWQCHHRLETHNSDGERRLVDILSSELIALGMYYDRPPEELIFLTELEHKRLHNVGKKFSEDHKKKMSEAHKSTMKGKHLSKETKKKLSEINKGKKGYWLGRKLSEEHRRKLSEARKGMLWFNNGTVSVRAKECPDGFVPGRLRK